jgi:hypothetical protein
VLNSRVKRNNVREKTQEDKGRIAREIGRMEETREYW